MAAESCPDSAARNPPTANGDERKKSERPLAQMVYSILRMNELEPDVP
jgi:hypothetical protein